MDPSFISFMLNFRKNVKAELKRVFSTAQQTRDDIASGCLG